MCGIAGIAARHPTKFDATRIHSAVRALAHRGPDGSGTYVDETFALGHTRLAILDLSEAGAQPMRSSDGRYVITFNGEIYNFPELRQDLEQRGVTLRGHSDTEVLLETYRVHGSDVLDRLNGIFAFAIADLYDKTLLVARDPVGVKPLYYAQGAFGFAFASEIKALLQLAPVSRTVDAVALRRYLTFLWSPGERTMLESVYKLGPGTMLLVENGRIKQSSVFGKDPVYDPRTGQSAESCARELTAEVDRAVDRQMISDAPLGAFLSGGVDSTAIVASARHQDRSLRCYTMAVEGHNYGEMADDLPYARQAAQALDVDLIEVRVGPDDIIDGMKRMVSDLDEPLADPACLNLRLISLAARADGIKVMLSGTGGDDIFSGYRRHTAAVYNRHIDYTPRIFSAALTKLAARQSGSTLRRAAKLMTGAGLDGDMRIANLFAWTPQLLAQDLINPAVYMGGESVYAPMLAELSAMRGAPDLEKCLKLERKFFLADHNLIYTDKMGMSAGIEIRVPLLDRELVAFAAQIPAAWKHRRLTPKWMFKQSQRGRVPASILSRSKTGFGVPLRKWMKGPLKEMCNDLLSHDTISRRGWFNAAAVARLISDNDAGTTDASYTLFSIMCIEMWAQTFLGSSQILPDGNCWSLGAETLSKSDVAER